MTESEIDKIEKYLGKDFETRRLTAQGWQILHDDRTVGLITDEVVLRAYMSRKKYIHDAECLYHPDNEDRLDDYWNFYDRSPGECDCPYEKLSPYGFSIIASMLDSIMQKVQEAKMMKLRQGGGMIDETKTREL